MSNGKSAFWKQSPRVSSTGEIRPSTGLSWVQAVFWRKSPATIDARFADIYENNLGPSKIMLVDYQADFHRSAQDRCGGGEYLR